MKAIERDIYVLDDRIEDQIKYVQGTNVVPIIFHVRDYNIMAEAKATVIVRKPSGHEIHGEAIISGNDITVNVTSQMTAEPGITKMQLRLTKGEEELFTYVQILEVKKSLVHIDSESGSPFLDKYIEEINAIITVALNDATEKGNYAKSMGDYAKEQGDYAKEKGEYAYAETLRIQKAFESWVKTLEGTVNGELLLEIKKLLDDMYRIATDTDIDKIIDGTYVDEDEQGSIFEAATNEDIDHIISGEYTDVPEENPDELTDEEVQEMVDNAFK